MEYYVSIGTPAGCFGNDSFKMIIVGDQLLKTNENMYKVWSAFVGIRSIEQAAEVIDMSEREIEKELQPMLDAGLIIPAKDVLDCIALRQGLGWGYDDNTNDFVINWGSPVHVPYTSYYIWCCCDGKMSLGETVNLMRENGMEIDNETTLKAVHTLLRRNVLLLGE